MTNYHFFITITLNQHSSDVIDNRHEINYFYRHTNCRVSFHQIEINLRVYIRIKFGSKYFELIKKDTHFGVSIRD